MFPYSVAQHCLAVSEILEVAGHEPAAALHGLLHDAEEALYGDIPRPLKAHLPADLRERMREARHFLMRDFGMPFPRFLHERLVKEADLWCLFAERRVLQPKSTGWWGNEHDRPAEWIAHALGVEPPETYGAVPCLPPVFEEPWRRVENAFLETYHRLRDHIELRNEP